MFTALPALAVLAVLGASLAITHRNASAEDRRGESAELAAAAAVNARGYLDDRFALLATIATEDDVRAGRPRMLTYLKRAAATGGFENGVGFVDGRGMSRISSSVPPGTPPVDLSDRLYVQQALAGRATVSEVLLGRRENRPLLTYAYPVRDVRGTVTGLVAGSLALDAAGKGLQRLLFTPDAGLTLVDAAGNIIVGDNPVRGLVPAPRGYRVAQMRQERRGALEAETAEGRRILGFATVPGTGWTVIVDREHGAVIGPLNRTLWIEIAALALFAVLGTLFTLATARRLDRLDLEREDALTEQREIALALQRSLMLPEFEVPDGLAVGAHYVPAQGAVSVGGDWYDLIDGEDGRVTFNIGDVAGHGLEAAATMGKLRSAARVEGLKGSPPAEALSALQRFAASLALRPLATVAYADLDLRTGLLRFALAGHPPPLLIRADGSTSYLEGGRSPLLGVEATEPRAQGQVMLRPGDTLVIYTDGLVERPESSLDEGLATLAERSAALVHDVATMAGRLLARVPEPRRDDAAVLIVQLTGVSSRSSRSSVTGSAPS